MLAVKHIAGNFVISRILLRIRDGSSSHVQKYETADDTALN